jgi:diacylglycerol kinase (ATP)
MKTMVILNPNAGPALRRAGDGLPTAGFPPADTEVVHPADRAEARRLACEAVCAGARTIVIVGGDGSVNAALPAVAGTGTALALVPAGSANDLARCHAIPRSHADAWALAASGSTRKVDLLLVNGHPVATAGGFGFPCDVACRADELRRRHPAASRFPGLRGSGVYLAAALSSTFHHVPERNTVTVSAEGFSYAGGFLWFLACNQGFLGRHFRVAPGARSDDGFMDLCIALEPGSRPAVLNLVWEVIRGSHRGSPLSRLGRARHASLRLSGPVTFFGDGEPLFVADTFDLDVAPGALTLVTPNGTEHP